MAKRHADNRRQYHIYVNLLSERGCCKIWDDD